MAAGSYFGSYGRFTAPEKEHAVHLMSADSLIGDELNYAMHTQDGKTRVVLSNRFGGEIGSLDAKSAHDIQLCLAKDWNVHVLLASIFQKHPEGGGRATHWGEVVILAYPPAQAEAFDVFTGNIAKMLSEGIRPEVELQQSSVTQVLESGGSWTPNGRHATVSKDGSVMLKGSLSLNDKLVEQARKRNPGCMFAGWVFIAALIFLVLYLVKLLLGF